MDSILIKLTAIGYQSSTAVQDFAEPKILLINPYKIFRIMTNKRGITEVVDESGRSVIYVQESPEEIYEMLNKN